MLNPKKFLSQFQPTSNFLRLTLLSIPVSIVTGLVVALFLWLLELATVTRWQHIWLIFFLPLTGVLIWALYRFFGKNSEAGNNLIIEEIHEPGGGVPARMTPLILLTTVLTHLTGGSAGREGTAVQMGGSLAALFSRWFQLRSDERSILLLCGIAAGFGAVFGTPLAGAVFALEVLTIGRLKLNALLPCLIAAVIADITCTAVGIHHTQYQILFRDSPSAWLPYVSLNLFLAAKVVLAGACFGLAAFLFAQCAHLIKRKSQAIIRVKWLIPIIGSVLIIGISYALGTFDYLGLGVTTPDPSGVSITSAFSAQGAQPFSWFWKLLLTAITLGMGFKGGEVTPLFFIGATLGNTLATLSGAPVDLFAAIGFLAVFAGATNTPLACTIMGVELFGADHVIYFALACFTAYYFSGHRGIYEAQRRGRSKWPWLQDN